MNTKVTSLKKSRKQPKTLLDKIKKEFQHFKEKEWDDERELPTMLRKVHTALQCVVVSSVEVERLFSASGCFITKLRTRLSDEFVDALCFLRAYFLKEEAKEKEKKDQEKKNHEKEKREQEKRNQEKS